MVEMPTLQDLSVIPVLEPPPQITLMQNQVNLERDRLLMQDDWGTGGNPPPVVPSTDPLVGLNVPVLLLIGVLAILLIGDL